MPSLSSGSSSLSDVCTTMSGVYKKESEVILSWPGEDEKTLLDIITIFRKVTATHSVGACFLILCFPRYLPLPAHMEQGFCMDFMPRLVS